MADEIPPGDKIPTTGGYLSEIDTVINIKAAQVHAAVGIGSDPESGLPNVRYQVPMVFIVGGLSIGTEKLNPHGQVAVALQPSTALGMIHACLMGLLSKDGVDAVMNRISELGRAENDKDNVVPALYEEAKDATETPGGERSQSFDAVLRKVIEDMIERGELPGDISDYNHFLEEEED